MFRIREVGRAGAISLMAACLGAGSALAGPVEQRCTELGSACLCSEPLRFTSGGWLYEAIDPPDSEGAGAKECAGGGSLDAEPTGIELVNRVDNASNVDFPGSNPPSYVLKMTAGPNDGDNGWKMIGNSLTGVRNETICARSYQRFGNNLPMVDGDMRAKLAEVIIDGTLIQHQVMHNGLGNLDTYSGDCIGNVNMQLAGRTSWLRHEFCLDVGTSSVSSRQRAVVIETGVMDTVFCGPYPISTPANVSDFVIGNLFIQTLGNSSRYGSRYFTHAIQTRVPLNPSFWPDAATELEGGSGGASGGGEPPPPAPEPDPLGKPGTPVYAP